MRTAATVAPNEAAGASDQAAAAKATPMPSMEEIVSLCKRRGFIFPSSDIYNGFNGFYDYGPLGVELKQNIKQAWWRHFVHGREDMTGLDSSIIASPSIWEASGRAKAPFGIAQSLPHRDHAAQLHLPVPLSASKWRSSTSSVRATTSGRTGGSGSQTRAGGSFLMGIGLREDLMGYEAHADDSLAHHARGLRGQ